MRHRSLWQVGLCYLDQCKEEGRARQQVLLSQIVATSDSKTMKIIQAALQRGLLDVGKCRGPCANIFLLEIVLRNENLAFRLVKNCSVVT